MSYPSSKTPTPTEFRTMHEVLDRAGVPHEFRRYQEPLVWEPQHDIVWQRKAVIMWKRSYGVALHIVDALHERVRRLKQQHWDTPMTFFYPTKD